MSNTSTLKISGISCATCVAQVERIFYSRNDIDAVDVNIANKTALISSPAEVDLLAVRQELQSAGYDFLVETVLFNVPNMSCASCVSKIENSLLENAGILNSTVNLASKTVSVTFVPTVVPPDGINQILSKIGYPGKLVEDAYRQSANADTTEAKTLANATLLAALLAAPVFTIEMGGHIFSNVHHWVSLNIGVQNSRIIQFLLTTLLIIGPGRYFFSNGLRRLAAWEPDMNSLVALGAGAAYIYSVCATFFTWLLPPEANNVYFESAAIIITLILIGRYLEARAKGLTGAAVSNLLDLTPQMARVERNGKILEIPVSEISINDQLHIHPGEKIAVDGTVISGSTYVDERMMTGEPISNHKSEGSLVLAGTLNGSGAMIVNADKVGSETALAQIIQTVENAQNTKLPIQRKVDWVAARFVPFVMLVAILTVACWIIFGPKPVVSYATVAAISVLIIACPCAMGLATPTSIIVGMGRAAQMGVLFRKGGALEQLQAADVIAFDKTGTLTKGIPKLEKTVIFGDVTEAEIIPILAAVEQKSEHPVGQAIAPAAAPEEIARLKVADFQALAGYGITADVGGQRIAIGTRALMGQESVNLAEGEVSFQQLSSQGKTCFFVSIDGKLAAVLAVSDQIRPDAAKTIQHLHQRGLKTVMISGDNSTAASAIASSLGIDQVFAEMLPKDKQGIIEKLRNDGQIVAFVGDGINDAPALAAADIGIAIGGGADTAIEAADVILSSSNLSSVLNALHISKMTLRNIWQNLFWAFGYNLLLIPVAAGVLFPVSGTLLSPAMAAGAMALSSLLVVLNALRLNFVKQKTSNDWTPS